MTPRARLTLLVAFAAASFGIVAVGLASGDSGAAAGGAPQPRAAVDVTFDEWRLEAGDAPVRAGQATFEEHNTGAVEHDLLIVRTDRPADTLPRGLEGVAPELAGEIVLGESHGDHHHDAEGSQAAGHGHAATHLEPGGRRRRTVTLEPGRYVLLCPVPGHYERGQAAAITVR